MMNSLTQQLSVRILLVSTIISGFVVGQQLAPMTEIDEATILLAENLDPQTRKALFTAVQGIPTQGDDKNTYLLVPENATVIILDSEGLVSQQSSAPSCEDMAPGEDFTCEEQSTFGKCDADFMLKGNYCSKTCNRCSTGGPMESSTGQECIPFAEWLESRGDLLSFKDALNIVGLQNFLSDPSYTATVLIPNDDAFFQALQSLGDYAPQLTQFGQVKKLIEGHIIPNMAIKNWEFVNDQPIIPLSNEGFWKVKNQDGDITIEGGQLGSANIIEPNIPTCQIIVHVVDKLLLF